MRPKAMVKLDMSGVENGRTMKLKLNPTPVAMKIYSYDGMLAFRLSRLIYQ